jgi:hypothetical protein
MIKPLFIISICGLIVSTIVHVATFFGVNPQNEFPAVWGLHFLLLAIWIPIILINRKIATGDNRKNVLRTIMKHTPFWLKALSAVLFIYAFIGFFYSVFVLNDGGVPSIISGQKVLESHGNIIRILTEQEYELHQAYSVRAFSSIWLIFYTVGIAALYSMRKENPE